MRQDFGKKDKGEHEMETGIYMGPAGQLVEVYINYLEGTWYEELSLRASEQQSYWLRTGSMALEMMYLIDGWEYLGPL